MNTIKHLSVSTGVALIAGVALSASAMFATADTKIERDGKVYIVADNEASSVCKSIVRDQPSQLRRALHHGLTPIERSRAHTFYQCNEKDLLSFAHEVEATKVVGYLTPKFYGNQRITTEEVASR
ncbi:DUF3718 domain-containing protein [Simiduia sp. 21SJ11W-1]|uniref:DUF3718 domain-containing protein n=1 Tax=Simiduia sp. 21SJ11W-1 TaxID=2909669 RepID=UPI0020A06D4A|nr:DUF3718 domain-containing protein [Simiduia sp. 21SJ11W-1]UTA47209.1 DUF3718 domain-containing protein [Simiduia sp. 21SJ11W-1]